MSAIMRTNWTGVGTALVTPFTRAAISTKQAVRRLARRQIDAGIHFLVPCGTTGENPTLTDAERVRDRRDSRGRGATGRCRCSPAPAATTRARSFTSPPRCSGPAPRASCRSRRTTTSRRRKGSYQHYRRSPKARRCRSSSTTCPAGPASTSSRRPLAQAGRDAEHRRREGSVGQHRRRCATCAAPSPPTSSCSRATMR